MPSSGFSGSARRGRASLKFFDQARKDSRGFEPYARQVAGMFADNPAVLEGIALLPQCDRKGRWCRSSGWITYLRSLSNIFGLDDHAFERITTISGGVDSSDPYKILGVERTISDDDLKRAYRALVRENHPDKLIAEGLPEELVELANEKLAAINDAYDQISADRGLN